MLFICALEKIYYMLLYDSNHFIESLVIVVQILHHFKRVFSLFPMIGNHTADSINHFVHVKIFFQKRLFVSFFDLGQINGQTHEIFVDFALLKGENFHVSKLHFEENIECIFLELVLSESVVHLLVNAIYVFEKIMGPYLEFNDH